MRRKQLYWSGGFSSILINAVTKELLCYETDSEKIHKEYGGKQFYISKSSGKGFITDKLDQLVEIGSYRKCGETSKIECSPGIYCYVPLDGHNGIDYDNKLPVIITDRRKSVIFVSVFSPAIVHAIMNFEEITNTKESTLEIDGQKIRRKTIKIRTYWVGGYEHVEVFDLYMYKNAPKSGIDMLLFIDKSEFFNNIKEMINRGEIEATGSFIHSMLSAYFCPCPPWGGEECWLGSNKHSIFDKKWEKDPREIIGELGDGWHGEGVIGGKALIWKRRGLIIYAIVDMEVDGQWEEYELEKPVFEWFAHPINYWFDVMAECLEEE